MLTKYKVGCSSLNLVFFSNNLQSKPALAKYLLILIVYTVTHIKRIVISRQKKLFVHGFSSINEQVQMLKKGRLIEYKIFLISVAQMHGKRILKLLQKIFSWLPLATVIDQKVLVLHGGISDVTDLSVLAKLDRHNVRMQPALVEKSFLSSVS